MKKMKQLTILLLVLITQICISQESIIVENKKIEWKDYDFLYENKVEGIFKPQIDYLNEVDLYEITYQSNGLNIESYAAIPKGEGKYPVIIYNRGGNRNLGAIQPFKGNRKQAIAIFFSRMAKEGYVVIGCNYRGCGKSEGNDEFGGEDVNDVLNLINVVKEMPEADENKIGMYGWSRGGMMTYLTLTRTNEIKAAVVGGAPADQTVIDRPIMEKIVYSELIPNYWENKEAELKKRSAIYFADKFPKDVPLLMLHGNSDWRVKSSNSLKLALELDKHRVPYRLKIFEGGDHGLGDFKEEVNSDVMNWFDRFLKNDESLPNMELHGN